MLAANFRNVGQFGPVVCPPVCWRKADLAVDQRGLRSAGTPSCPGPSCRAAVDRARADGGQEHALRVDPAVPPPARSAAPALMNTGRGAHRATSSCESTGRSPRQRAGVLEVVAGHPVVLARAGDVLDQLAEVAAVQLRAAGAGRADEADGEALVVRHRDERGLAVARQPLDADPLRVDGLVGLEVVERAARAPGPGRSAPQSSSLRGWPLLTRPMMPRVRPAPLSAWMLVGDDDRVAPALGEDLLLPRMGPPAARRRPPAGPARRARPPPPNSMITGTGPFAFAGVVSVNWMSTSICGYAELSTCPTSFFVTTGTSPSVPFVVLVTSHVTFGVSFGRRP